ncbi:hypothetical protein M404DRAFT_1002907 [Pisolithus tinctorius Marx 270]|uniref:Uncharacterized protein n=1 Tax=Pisolithus tinctorius Marx 270 TaxID=870435 RepID=A0A0C3JWJ3_PISTI|nr:hypothetical protein M404DRAFT_1002907 [Pisolithus tinctorius Marx 270]
MNVSGGNLEQCRPRVAYSSTPPPLPNTPSGSPIELHSAKAQQVAWHCSAER